MTQSRLRACWTASDDTPADSAAAAGGEVVIGGKLGATSIHEPGCARLLMNGAPWHLCGGTYVCPRCEREFGWCIGAADDTPSLCDECAVFIQELA